MAFDVDMIAQVTLKLWSKHESNRVKEVKGLVTTKKNACHLESALALLPWLRGLTAPEREPNSIVVSSRKFLSYGVACMRLSWLGWSVIVTLDSLL